ncbi:MAG: response regulator [Deltaproteobacteria bacterium]|nr:response regulator [Deltaproteobacteria bacterium]
MHKKKILIVEDDESISVLEKDLLEREGFQVEIARDGAEGLERIKNNRYDAIISDFEMPKMKGDQLYLKVMTLNQEQAKRIIFVSGNINEFIESTGNRFLPKPFSSKALVKLVKDFIKHNRGSTQ